MSVIQLAQSVEQFAQFLAGASESGLERAWSWQSYDSEGVRFAFFRTYEEIRDLAARLHEQRAESPTPLTETQRILAQYHAGYRDLQAALLGITVEQMEQAPMEGQWPVRLVLGHILSAEFGFYVLIRYALDNLRGGLPPAPIPDEAWPRLSGLDEAAVEKVVQGPVNGILEQFEMRHTSNLVEFATISAEELDGLSYYWEAEPYPLRFRLHRLDSHIRQHTVQVDKTLSGIGAAPDEPRRLLRLIYTALAEAEGAAIGFPELDLPDLAQVSASIAARGTELAEILAKP